jgi:DNA-binding NtrC family response regulator
MQPDGHGQPSAASTVLLLDDDADLLDVLGSVIGEVCERACLAAKSYEELVRLGDRALSCDVAILDVNLGPGRPSGVDAYQWLQDRGFHGKIAFLTGHAKTHPAVLRACQVQAATVHQKPISISTLRSICCDEAA